MPIIMFTQLLRPDGRKATIAIDRPVEVANQASLLLDAGCRLEAEVLMGGEASFEVLAPWEFEGDPITLAHEIVPNGPRVPAAIDKLIGAARLAFDRGPQTDE